MRNPTPVTTRIITTQRASRVKERLGENQPTEIHGQITNANDPPAGGQATKVALAAAAAAKDRPTDPAPIVAIARFGSLAPSVANRRKPARGRAGMHQVQFNISVSLPVTVGDI
jgi:hypothetical protein